MSSESDQSWHGTTILSLRKDGKVVIAGDGQVSFGQTVLKSNAKKLRRLGNGSVLAGFAGATADALTLFERLEAMMAVADKTVSLILSGNGDVLEPEDAIIGIGSGGPYALAAARALIDQPGLDAEAIARKAMTIAAKICIYTNENVTVDVL